MNKLLTENLRYSIYDPTGNITALVESMTDIEDQPSAAESIMSLHPEVEQVGFVRFDAESPYNAGLRMAGGEFCGNAAMCTAVSYYLKKKQENAGAFMPESPSDILLKVSGSSVPVEVRLEECAEGTFKTGILMPDCLEISSRRFTYKGRSEELPVVVMEGISHVIISPDCGFYELMTCRTDAVSAIRTWCRNCAGMGLMFIKKTADATRLIPLVFIPGCDTMFWENSCASGSAAIGMYLSSQTGKDVDETLLQPGGSLRVRSEKEKIRLYGTVRLIGSC